MKWIATSKVTFQPSRGAVTRSHILLKQKIRKWDAQFSILSGLAKLLEITSEILIEKLHCVPTKVTFLISSTTGSVPPASCWSDCIQSVPLWFPASKLSFGVACYHSFVFSDYEKKTCNWESADVLLELSVEIGFWKRLPVKLGPFYTDLTTHCSEFVTIFWDFTFLNFSPEISKFFFQRSKRN